MMMFAWSVFEENPNETVPIVIVAIKMRFLDAAIPHLGFGWLEHDPVYVRQLDLPANNFGWILRLYQRFTFYLDYFMFHQVTVWGQLVGFGDDGSWLTIRIRVRSIGRTKEKIK